MKIRNWKSQFKVEMSPKRNYGLQILGCYDQSSLQEKHEFGLVFALSKLEAKIYQNLNDFWAKKILKMILHL